ncbi:hypothetical protein SAMN05421837_1215 [Amycolatopsis pretoriensis]|uniref:ATP dependent DNA ligase domain-containing protein n=1 Tax=Amycolatopsis pretoriensis TaxID=218821 RepID=A0A1H5RJU7_9PSEU|nr:hypothetical protein SAMN05421837_1215 [Amycolatopsis pretoriensis]
MVARASSHMPGWTTPMLAKPDDGRLHTGPEWAYEYKLDGYRACMQIASDGTTVLTSPHLARGSSSLVVRCEAVPPMQARYCGFQVMTTVVPSSR